MKALYTNLFPYKALSLVLPILFILPLQTALGQVRVRDETGITLSFYDVLLLNMQESWIVNSIIIDRSGAFLINNIEHGEYIIKASSIRHQPTCTSPVSFYSNRLVYNALCGSI